jgi:hypothetical protein
MAAVNPDREPRWNSYPASVPAFPVVSIHGPLALLIAQPTSRSRGVTRE